ncbi:osmotically inducible protein OsmC [Brumimicrobium salinarum]|uniref:Osmotically inducible protein OsmC n=1 Tax=Brumimicrobium salinarum TaxID=2058658 RepID=A0A2I0R460_9FLAO|nr:OsmC family protein [Brumimicrobium salinarum]PKR81339.1 osmotically inducible protein OsmC [Brumimicrobium salinarum]
MSSIQSKTKEENYEVTIETNSGHTVTSDEPKDVGGQNKGLVPDEFLIAGLAGCTSATLKMYAQRKEWDLQDVNMKIKFIEGEKKGDLPSIQTDIELIGDLDRAQKERLLVIAGKCPVHKMLTGGLTINTAIK